MADKADLKLSLSFQGGQSQWLMAKDQDYPKGPGQYPGLSVRYNDTGEFTFNILTQTGVKFASTNPFTPKADKPNPPDFADQFTVTGHGTTKLVVKVANANKAGGPYGGGEYHYALNFSNGSTLDPIITNGGCCRNFNTNHLVYYALGAVALLVLIILIVRPMMAKR